MRTLAAIAVLLLALSATAFAQGPRRSAVSYGAYCESPYGFCRKELNSRQAVHALRMFFHHRGLRVEVLQLKGRFIKANIYNGPNLVDTILLDRKTGRMRSIY
jgi:hypothetical protein